MPVDDRGVVPGLVPRPALAGLIALLGGADLADELGGAVVADDVDDSRPGQEVIQVGDPGGAVAQQRDAVQALAREGAAA